MSRIQVGYSSLFGERAVHLDRVASPPGEHSMERVVLRIAHILPHIADDVARWLT